MKRFLALLSAIAMLASFVACGNAKDTDETTASTTSTADNGTTITTTTTAETKPLLAFDTVPEQQLGGTFHIRYAMADNCYEDFHAEAQNGDVKNDAIYKRNTMVEEKLGISLEISWDDHAVIDTDCKTQVQSGDHSYDLFGGHRDSLSLGYSGMQYNLADITTLDLTQKWWDQGWIDSISASDTLFTVIGDIGVSSMLFVSALTFNKELMNQNQIAYPYDLVRQGKWTMDEFYNTIINFGSDLNGDSKIDRDNDLLSLVGWSWEAGFSNFYGADFSFINKDANGIPEIAYDTDKLTSVTEKIVALWNSDYAYFCTTSGAGADADHVVTYNIFNQGRALFSDIVLSKIGTFYADMEQDYGIIPLPKYDEQQANYKSYLGLTIPILFIASNTPDPERTGTVMEALCTASYDNVTPQMYEIVTKLKNARDEDSSEMIEIIIRNKHIDAAHFYSVTGYCELARNMIMTSNSNPSSIIKGVERVAQKEWERIMSAMEKVG